jgi:SAM-dependent methyltransferase
MLRLLRDFRRWQQLAEPTWRANIFDLKWRLEEAKTEAGHARGHYFLQDLWAAQAINARSPVSHVDVGSRIDGFVAHVAAFCPVEYVDVRPLQIDVPGICSRLGRIEALPYDDRSVQSLSCLHVLEHIGLGRYGDPIDPAAWRLGVGELQRVLAPGGQLVFSTPVGRERVVFHAHRVFAAERILEAFDQLELGEFSLITDNRATRWQERANPEKCRGLTYGCGLFRFYRPTTSKHVND